MGGVICTLADFTFAVCSNFNQPHTVSLNCSVNFLGMAKGKKLFSSSSVIKDGRSSCVYQIDINDELHSCKCSRGNMCLSNRYNR